MNDLYDVVIVTISYYPAEDASARLFRDLAEGLCKKGLKVAVVTPNREYLNPDRVFSTEEVHSGVTIVRIPLSRLNKNNTLQKGLLYLSFAKKASTFVKEMKKRLIISVLPPLLVPHRILKYCYRNQIPFLFIIFDVLPDAWENRRRINPKNPLSLFLKRQMTDLLTLSDRIVVVGRDMRQHIEDRYAVPGEKISVIQNWARIPGVKGLKTEDNQESEKFIVLYAGNHGEPQKLDRLVNAARILQGIDSSVEFLLVGDGRKKQDLKNLSAEWNLKNIRFHDFVGDEELRLLMERSSLLLVTLREESKGVSVPSKLYTYLTAGKPILAIVPSGSEIDLAIKEDGFGISVSGENAKAVADAIITLREDSEFAEQAGENALRAFRTKYNENAAIEKYYCVVSELIGKTKKGEGHV